MMQVAWRHAAPPPVRMADFSTHAERARRVAAHAAVATIARNAVVTARARDRALLEHAGRVLDMTRAAWGRDV